METALTIVAPILVALVLLRAWMAAKTVVIEDYEDALLVRAGRAHGQLSPGRRLVWRRTDEVLRCDLREQVLAIVGQEVLSADAVPLKVSLTLTYRLVGARARREVADWGNTVHLAVQHALRDAAGAVELEALLADRTLLDGAMGARLKQEAERLALAEISVALKDLMVGGDLKRALADVARARAEGRARLERARGETAALRNLTNAAKLLEQHAGLAHLRLLEVASAAAEGTGNQLVLRLDRDVLDRE